MGDADRSAKRAKKTKVSKNTKSMLGEVSAKKDKKKPVKKGDKEATIADPNANPSDKVKEAFEKFMLDTFETGPEKMVKEYEKDIKPYFPADLRRAVFDAHAEKNRYKDVVCNDNTRVVLNDCKGTDYIHANYVRGEPLHNTFICTQGPTEKTLFDFTRMIVSERVRNIFMLCELLENGKKKCERYWPEKVGDKLMFGDITVTTTEVIEKDAHIVMSTLEFHPSDHPRPHIVKHYHWKTWPDKHVPKSLLAVFRLLKNSRLSRSPTVVHCSAGIGRTGTLVAVEMCLQRLFSDKEFKRVETIRHLKDQRCHSVQVDVQYVYVMTALCEYGKAMGLVEKDDILKKYTAYLDDYEALLAKKTPEADKTQEGKNKTIEEKEKTKEEKTDEGGKKKDENNNYFQPKNNDDYFSVSPSKKEDKEEKEKKEIRSAAFTLPTAYHQF